MATTLDSPLTPATKAPALDVAPARSSPWKIIFGVVVGLALIAWLGRLGLHAYHYEETDDAYVTGHLLQISPQLDGQVKEILVVDNQTVHAGDVLVRLDPLEFELAAQKARAALDQARAQVTEARAAAAQAEAQIAEAEAHAKQAEAQTAQTTAQLELARITLGRNEDLFSKGGVITQADLDTTRSAYRAADAAQSANQANVTAAQSAIGSAKAMSNSAQAQITAAVANAAVAESAVRNADRELSYATITAPADGRIGNKMVELGNRVLAGQALFSLAAEDSWVIANFKETQLARMRVGQPVELTIDALPGHPLHGTIDSIAPASGAQFALLPADNATGNFNKVVQRVPVKIILDEASRHDLGDRLRLGLSAVVNVRIR